MKKSDLRTGMIVTTRAGNKYMVVLNAKTESYNTCDILLNLNDVGWLDLEDYNEDMKHEWLGGVEKFDIMQVEHLCAPSSLSVATRDLKAVKLLLDYQRKEKKRYTYAQIKKIIGEEFEVVANTEDVKEMTLDDLKTGMIVTLREGHQYMVYKCASNMRSIYNVAVAIDGTDNWVNLNLYRQDLTETSHPQLDIMKVEQVTHPYAFIRLDYEAANRKVLWERKKRYTYNQLKEILGEEFEIVKE